MNKNFFMFLVPFLLVGRVGSAATNNSASTEGALKPASGIVPIPALYYTPETSVAAGGVLIYYFRNDDDLLDAKPSQIKPIVIVTKKKQLITSLLLSRRWNQGQDHLSIFSRYRRYPDKIWDIGPLSKSESEEDYSANIASTEAYWEHAIGGDFTIGPIAWFYTYQITKHEKNGLIENSQLIGTGSARTAAMGLRLGLDSRDNIFSPSRGSLGLLRAVHVEHQEETLKPYKEILADYRYYLTPVPAHTVALRLTAQGQEGDVPFRALSSIGGPDSMRGYYEGRFRDKVAISGEAEYRFPVWWRFRGAAFASAGNVGNDIDQVVATPVKKSFGGGLRYVVDEKEGIVIRLDVGRTDESSGLYIQLDEAF